MDLYTQASGMQVIYIYICIYMNRYVYMNAYVYSVDLYTQVSKRQLHEHQRGSKEIKSTLVVGRSVMKFPEFWLAPLANLLEETPPLASVVAGATGTFIALDSTRGTVLTSGSEAKGEGRAAALDTGAGASPPPKMRDPILYIY